MMLCVINRAVLKKHSQAIASRVSVYSNTPNYLLFVTYEANNDHHFDDVN